MMVHDGTMVDTGIMRTKWIILRDLQETHVFLASNIGDSLHVPDIQDPTRVWYLYTEDLHWGPFGSTICYVQTPNSPNLVANVSFKFWLQEGYKILYQNCKHCSSIKLEADSWNITNPKQNLNLRHFCSSKTIIKTIIKPKDTPLTSIFPSSFPRKKPPCGFVWKYVIFPMK